MIGIPFYYVYLIFLFHKNKTRIYWCYLMFILHMSTTRDVSMGLEPQSNL